MVDSGRAQHEYCLSAPIAALRAYGRTYCMYSWGGVAGLIRLVVPSTSSLTFLACLDTTISVGHPCEKY